MYLSLSLSTDLVYNYWIFFFIPLLFFSLGFPHWSVSSVALPLSVLFSTLPFFIFHTYIPFVSFSSFSHFFCTSFHFSLPKFLSFVSFLSIFSIPFFFLSSFIFAPLTFSSRFYLLLAFPSFLSSTSSSFLIPYFFHFIFLSISSFQPYFLLFFFWFNCSPFFSSAWFFPFLSYSILTFFRSLIPYLPLLIFSRNGHWWWLTIVCHLPFMKSWKQLKNASIFVLDKISFKIFSLDRILLNIQLFLTKKMEWVEGRTKKNMEVRWGF